MFNINYKKIQEDQISISLPRAKLVIIKNSEHPNAFFRIESLDWGEMDYTDLENIEWLQDQLKYGYRDASIDLSQYDPAGSDLDAQELPAFIQLYELATRLGWKLW